MAAGLLNVLPGAGAVSPAWARSAYGVDVTGVDLETLMRHRAILLALVGVTVIVSAFRPHLRPAAVAINAASFGTFLLLVLTTPSLNQQVVRVAQVDAVALLVLSAGTALLASGPCGRRTTPAVRGRE
ncbi:hypothetical protein ACIBO1_20405 [Micromonospora sp. NPDC049903]|uniref:hypothetical protein n=1 Tax=Micromonospora sp. NPDC049903 TaxID=3364276 RepID=UPI0037A4C7CF